jgi:hypothetical protein
MGETVKDVLAHAQWLISKGRAEEPAKLLLPRIEAKRRAQNKGQRTRVQFDCTPEQYAAFHTQLKRIREHIGNITVAQDVVNEWLSLLKEETMDAMTQEDTAETLGNA